MSSLLSRWWAGSASGSGSKFSSALFTSSPQPAANATHDALASARRTLAGGNRTRGLTIVHGSRHTPAEYALHAHFFSEGNESWLVQRSDLLVSTNNMSFNVHELERALAAYPHRRKAFVRTAENSGRRCGHLQAIQALEALWSGYGFVLFLHPDVYLLKAGLENLGGAVQQAHRETSFIVTAFGYKGQRRSQWTALRMFNTDCFAFFPAALRRVGLCGTGSAGEAGGGAPWTRTCDAHETEAPERCARHTTLSFAPPRCPAQPLAHVHLALRTCVRIRPLPVLSARRSSLYVLAHLAAARRAALAAPEAVPARAARPPSAHAAEVANRSAPLVVGPLRWAGNRHPDGLGLWHTHHLEDVRASIRSHHAEQLCRLRFGASPSPGAPAAGKPGAAAAGGGGLGGGDERRREFRVELCLKSLKESRARSS